MVDAQVYLVQVGAWYRLFMVQVEVQLMVHVGTGYWYRFDWLIGTGLQQYISQ
jgi:hypothetical protein